MEIDLMPSSQRKNQNQNFQNKNENQNNNRDNDNDDDDDDNDDDDTEEEMFTVRINLSLSAHANAQQYYAKRRANQTKYESAVATAEKAVSAAKMKHEKMLQSKQKTVSRIKIQRKRYWFEKFDWFISPEGYLVIAGRNAQQNETLVKRYLRHGIDVFVRVICISFSFSLCG